MLKSFADLGRFRVKLEESWLHEADRLPENKVWYEYVPIRGQGFIYLQSETRCAAYVPSVGTIKNMAAALKAAKITHTLDLMDGEGVIYFDLTDFLPVAKILGARRKHPGGNPENIKKLVEAGKSFRFSTVDKGSKTGQEGQEK